MEHNPETGSVCPMLHFTEPINSGVVLPVQNTLSSECTSSGSPTLVPARKIKHNVFILKNCASYQFHVPQ